MTSTRLEISPPGHRKGLVRSIRDQKPANRRFLKLSDLLALTAIGSGLLLALALPEAAYMRMAQAARRVGTGLLVQKLGAENVALAGGLDKATAERLVQEINAERLLASALFLRSVARGASYDIRVDGTEHLDAALKEGRGAVLWVADFAHAGDVAKIGLSRLHYRVSHLSRPEHGFSDSLFGIRLLNRIRTGFELRFLRERIVHNRDRPGEAVGRLLERLCQNDIVSIMATGYEGRELYHVDFLHGRLPLAAGAPKIGFRAGSPVLPVFAVRQPGSGAFQLSVDRPLELRGGSEKEAVATAIIDYASRLERRVCQHPRLWVGWSALQPTSSAPDSRPALQGQPHVSGKPRWGAS